MIARKVYCISVDSLEAENFFNGWAMSTLILILLVLFVIYGVYLYNRTIRLEQLTEEAWSGIDVQLKRRFDLVPALVETVKGYVEHEQDALIGAVRARMASEGDGREALDTRQAQEHGITREIGQLFAVAEAYPVLKADQRFQDLQSSLSEIEDDLQYARRYYNGCVRDFNIFISLVPLYFFIGVLNKVPLSFFEIERIIEKENPTIDLS